MESAVLFTLARARGLRASVILVASDNAVMGTAAVAEQLSPGVASAIDVALAAARSLGQRPADGRRCRE